MLENMFYFPNMNLGNVGSALYAFYVYKHGNIFIIWMYVYTETKLNTL